MSKCMLLAVVMFLQVCLTMADVSDESESQGVLERAKEMYKELKASVVDAGSTAFEFIHMYYEDQSVKPVTNKYTEWAQEKAKSFWDTIKNKVSSTTSG